MAYFLRYTETPNADVERGYSYHWGDFSEKEATIEEAAAAYGCEVDDIEVVNGVYNVSLAGLCAFALEAGDLEDAIEEAQSHYFSDDYNANGSISYVIIKGSYIGECPEGDLIIAKEIVHTVKKENFAE